MSLHYNFTARKTVALFPFQHLGALLESQTFHYCKFFVVLTLKIQKLELPTFHCAVEIARYTQSCFLLLLPLFRQRFIPSRAFEGNYFMSSGHCFYGAGNLIFSGSEVLNGNATWCNFISKELRPMVSLCVHLLEDGNQLGNQLGEQIL